MRHLKIKYRNGFIPWLSILIIFIIISCQTQRDQESPEDFLFDKVGQESSGLDFINAVDPYNEINIINYLYAFNGGGVGIADLDNDGLSDIVLTANRKRNRVYFNKGNLEFEDGTIGSGLLEEESWSTGVTIVDINDDGLKDIYISNVNNGSTLNGINRLYINQGDRVFKESAKNYNLDISALSTQSAFFDYDRDGDLDMYLLCHSIENPSTYSEAGERDERHDLSADRLLKNEKGIFIDVSASQGIYQSKVGYGLGLSVSDINGDGWPDIYVSNDFHENDYLYINNRQNGFVESSRSAFTYTSKFSMGCDVADINGDQQLDILTLDMKPSSEMIYKQSQPPDTYQIQEFRKSFGYHNQHTKNTLQINYGNDESGIPIFGEAASYYGLDATDWSWSILIEDYNQDGVQDIFVTNGIYRRPNNMDYLNYISDQIVQQNDSDSMLISKMPEGHMQNLLFVGGEESYDVSSDVLAGNEPSISNGAAYADLDNDGDLDLVINNYNAPVSLLENLSNKNYLKIDFSHNRDAQSFNAKVRLYSNKKIYYKELLATRGFQSSVEPILVYALADTSVIDSLSIEWIGGYRTVLYNVESGTTIYPKTNADSYPRKKDERWPRYGDTLSLDFVHAEDSSDDFVADRSLLYRISDEGPAFAKGDVNEDGLEDIFLGGASGQPSALYVNQGGFYQKTWETQSIYEDVDAEFGDLDNDGDLDLVVAAGSGSFPEGYMQNKNRIYVNDGLGNFAESYYYFDNNSYFTSSVAISDVDGDGWKDIFFGSMSISGAYGLSPVSRILKNIDAKEYVDIPSDRLDNLTRAGMVTDAVWADLDGDLKEDLVVVGHWMPVTIYWNTGQSLKREEIQASSGLYNTIEVSDINNDGLPDVLLGNIGKNHPLMGDDLQLKLFLNDFNRDTIVDHLPVYTKQNKDFPIFHKNIVESQFNIIRKTIPTYSEYSNLAIWDLFSGDIMNNTYIKTVSEFGSYALINQSNRTWEKVYFPPIAQFSPVYAITRLDNKILLAGNDYGFQPLAGQMDVPLATVLSYNEGEFDLHLDISILLKGQVRHMSVVDSDEGHHIIVVRNNDKVSTYKLTETY